VSVLKSLVLVAPKGSEMVPMCFLDLLAQVSVWVLVLVRGGCRVGIEFDNLVFVGVLPMKGCGMLGIAVEGFEILGM